MVCLPSSIVFSISENYRRIKTAQLDTAIEHNLAREDGCRHTILRRTENLKAGVLLACVSVELIEVPTKVTRYQHFTEESPG